MSRAICNTCGQVLRWTAYRGASIKDVRCACGGTCRAYADPDRTRTPAPWYARIRTPARYMEHRGAYRAGLRGDTLEAYFGPLVESYAQEGHTWGLARVRAFRAGQDRRQAHFEGRTGGHVARHY